MSERREGGDLLRTPGVQLGRGELVPGLLACPCPSPCCLWSQLLGRGLGMPLELQAGLLLYSLLSPVH